MPSRNIPNPPASETMDAIAMNAPCLSSAQAQTRM